MDVNSASDSFPNIPGFIADTLWSIDQFVARNYAFLLTAAGIIALIVGFILAMVPF